MATVWRGEDPLLARPVAVKTLDPMLAEDEALRTRFRREAVAAAAVAHPNIVATYDTGEDDGVVAESGKVRTRSKSLAHLAEKLAAASDPRYVYVFHAQAPDIDEFLERITKIVPRDRIELGEIGPVIGTHAGPRTIGLGWVDAP